ncbi:MAG: hypothetical protein FJ020_07950 [Chloroflexi bacterium]|nr:hypothetical protein [Chloroflexota bacterium]
MAYQSVPMGLGIMILLSLLCLFLLASVLLPLLWKVSSLLAPLFSRALHRARHGEQQVVPVATERRWASRYDR